MREFRIWKNHSASPVKKASIGFISSPESGANVQAVKVGFCWPAFFFGLIWGCRTRLYLISIALFSLSFLLSFLMDLVVVDENNLNIIALLQIIVYSLIFGFLGNKWREKNLKSRGYKSVDVVKASAKEEAISKMQKSEENTTQG